ncbi:hypothetical protein RIR_jg15223.t1 [Rhizophagus irregularis DAOM 181602=DAOM 197198]|nr:hypothetical protein RIR_jg15223.t1 [Rhizophagus irregularis DAOM 181602=DAOM 197198]
MNTKILKNIAKSLPYYFIIVVLLGITGDSVLSIVAMPHRNCDFHVKYPIKKVLKILLDPQSMYIPSDQIIDKNKTPSHVDQH